MSPDGVLTAIAEIPGHPWFIGVQFHPELKSKFFFSSRRRHTRYWRDWSSDVCSSDLHVHGARIDIRIVAPHGLEQPLARKHPAGMLQEVPEQSEFGGSERDRMTVAADSMARNIHLDIRVARSEERRVGKECRSR